MCGIAGTIQLDGSAAQRGDRAAVTRVTELQARRGPDGEGLYADGAVVLGHRRLAIIDLSDDGRQPMSNEDATITVTFNGEIYNYRELRSDLLSCGHSFHSASDTEVLLHGYEQWGIEGLLKRLRGMFAFALYDARRGAGEDGTPFFFAARDRLGIKPFYYSASERCLAFASEARQLVRAGLASSGVDPAAVATFLSLGAVSSPRTWFKDVQCLPPGHFLAVKRGRVEVRKYWEITYDPKESAAGIATVLSDAVQRHLVADVPVGVFLSGGVDSGVVAARAARGRSAPVRTLTITFEEREFDESGQARSFAKAFGTEHHEVRVSARDFAQEIPKLLDAIDQPTADGVNTYFVSRAARQLGLKVVLSGLGGDELFFGYPHYHALAGGTGALGNYMRSGALLRGALGYGAALYGSSVGSEKWQRFEYCRERPFYEGLYLLIRGFFPPRQVRSLTGLTASNLNAALDHSFDSLRRAGENGHHDPNRFNYLEMRRYLHDQLLRDSDVFSMAHSIELRVPLLDNEVVDAASRIAPAAKLSAAMNKPQLVAAADEPCIREAAVRPKRGFTFPFAQWMLAQAEELEERARTSGLLEPSAVRECWRHFRAGRLHWSRAWATVVVSA